eukprot:7142958-Alexandrium_andersonii.AAC.1
MVCFEWLGGAQEQMRSATLKFPREETENCLRPRSGEGRAKGRQPPYSGRYSMTRTSSTDRTV